MYIPHIHAHKYMYMVTRNYIVIKRHKITFVVIPCPKYFRFLHNVWTGQSFVVVVASDQQQIDHFKMRLSNWDMSNWDMQFHGFFFKNRLHRVCPSWTCLTGTTTFEARNGLVLVRHVHLGQDAITRNSTQKKY